MNEFNNENVVQKLTPIGYFKLVLSKFADFSGRSRRSEYWYFFLINSCVYLTCDILYNVFIESGSTIPLLVLIFKYIYMLAICIPSLAVSVRRLHDIGKSGWNILLVLLPIVGILLFVWFATDGEPNENKWGVDPKGRS